MNGTTILTLPGSIGLLHRVPIQLERRRQSPLSIRTIQTRTFSPRIHCPAHLGPGHLHRALRMAPHGLGTPILTSVRSIALSGLPPAHDRTVEKAVVNLTSMAAGTMSTHTPSRQVRLAVRAVGPIQSSLASMHSPVPPRTILITRKRITLRALLSGARRELGNRGTDRQSPFPSLRLMMAQSSRWLRAVC